MCVINVYFVFQAKIRTDKHSSPIAARLQTFRCLILHYVIALTVSLSRTHSTNVHYKWYAYTASQQVYPNHTLRMQIYIHNIQRAQVFSSTAKKNTSYELSVINFVLPIVRANNACPFPLRQEDPVSHHPSLSFCTCSSFSYINHVFPIVDNTDVHFSAVPVSLLVL